MATTENQRLHKVNILKVIRSVAGLKSFMPDLYCEFGRDAVWLSVVVGDKSTEAKVSIKDLTLLAVEIDFWAVDFVKIQIILDLTVYTFF